MISQKVYKENNMNEKYTKNAIVCFVDNPLAWVWGLALSVVNIPRDRDIPLKKTNITLASRCQLKRDFFVGDVHLHFSLLGPGLA